MSRLTVFDLQRFALHDGPGIRTTVFLKGCPLDCVWCHNPESKSTKPQIGFLAKNCTGCGRCAAVCEENVHRLEGTGIHQVVYENCKACGRCVKACPRHALKIYGGNPSDSQEGPGLLREKRRRADSQRRRTDAAV